MKFILVDGKIKFLSHKVEWQEKRKQYNPETKKMEDILSNVKSQEFWNIGAKDNFITRLAERDIEVTVTELEQPSAELLAKCEGKLFSEYSKAIAFVNGEEIPKTQLEIMQETIDMLLLSNLEG